MILLFIIVKKRVKSFFCTNFTIMDSMSIYSFWDGLKKSEKDKGGEVRDDKNATTPWNKCGIMNGSECASATCRVTFTIPTDQWKS